MEARLVEQLADQRAERIGNLTVRNLVVDDHNQCSTDLVAQGPGRLTAMAGNELARGSVRGNHVGGIDLGGLQRDRIDHARRVVGKG